VTALDAGPSFGPPPGPNGPGSTPKVATVLVCDDDASVRALLVRVLHRAGYLAVPVATAGEAIEVLETTSVDAVMADHRMHAMTGIELHGRIAQRHPGLGSRFLLMTGDPEEDSVIAFARQWRLQVLAKPFDLRQIAVILGDLLAS
jgi:DNA-binding NtrC family response regulator